MRLRAHAASGQTGVGPPYPKTPTRIGVNETSFRKGHDYVTVVTDQPCGQVLHVADERKTGSLASYDETLTETQKAGLEHCDGYVAYLHQGTLDQIPEAESKIAFDKFHVAKYLGGRRSGTQAGA